MSRQRRLLVTILLAALFGGLASAPRAAAKKSAAAQWIDGPVRYIAKREELKVFRALKDDADRVRFIDKFWQRRDPTPGTPENEYRNLFWSRVGYANERLAEGAGPGWKTDRGKLLVLCGEPDRIENLPNAETKAGPTAGHGLLRWIYERHPCGRADLGPIVIVPFIREATGEYVLSNDPRLSSLAFNPSDLTNETLKDIEKWLKMVGTPERSELSVMADLGKLQEGPHPEERIVERVETSEAYGSHPLAAAWARFAHPRGGTLLVLTAAAPVVDEHTAPSFVARLSPKDPARSKRFLGEESFRLEGSGAERVAQARIVLEPGVWDILILSVETGVPTSGIYRGTAEIRAAAAALTLSDLVLARTLEPLPYSALVSYDEPFLVGPFRVVPRAVATVARGEPVRAFVEVYGGQGPFRFAYQLEGRESDGTWRELGPPATREDTLRSQGYALETKPAWPAGEYRLRLAVQDRDGAAASALLPFTLDPPTGGGASPPPGSAPPASIPRRPDRPQGARAP